MAFMILSYLSYIMGHSIQTYKTLSRIILFK